jgi:hypothetical protein
MMTLVYIEEGELEYARYIVLLINAFVFRQPYSKFFTFQ